MSNAQIIYPVASESDEQIALIKWWRMQYPQFVNLLFHIPNGGKRNIPTAIRFKKEGVVAGVADLFLAIPVDQWHGHFIELKRRKGGQLSEAQKRFGYEVRQQGYLYSVCHGWHEAMHIITLYMRNYGTSNKTSCL